MSRILPIEPKNYACHPIHREGRIWAETNCYCDVMIELLHALGYEPRAALPFTLGIDFEGDQWTFFKFREADLALLYALQIEELAPWRPLPDHIEEQVRQGRPVLVEVDSYFLPDTQGTAYQLSHVKSTIVVNEIDIEGRKLGYFHNQGYHVLQGDNFKDIFQVGGLAHERMLPPYIEFAKPQAGGRALTGVALRDASVKILRDELERLPTSNPFVRFRAKFAQDMAWLLTSDVEVFHAYSFATFRQFGACFELAETYLRWLQEQGLDDVGTAADDLRFISETSKALQLQLARAMARKRDLELDVLDAMAERWARATSLLRATVG